MRRGSIALAAPRVLLRTLVHHGSAARSTQRVQGEMGATVFFYPWQWARVADMVSSAGSRMQRAAGGHAGKPELQRLAAARVVLQHSWPAAVREPRSAEPARRCGRGCGPSCVTACGWALASTTGRQQGLMHACCPISLGQRAGECQPH